MTTVTVDEAAETPDLMSGPKNGGLVLVVLFWLGAMATAVWAMVDAQSKIADSADISAIQIQQVNSDAMLVIVTAAVLALGVSCMVMVARQKR